MYKVSVIMPIYNNETTLRRAIESILQQSSYDFELILVNDGSTDSSTQICREYAQKEPLLIQYIQQERLGLAQARNRGLQQAEGSYVYFANPQHVFAPQMLETNLRLAEEKHAELVVFGFAETKEGPEQIPKMPFLLSKDRFRNHYRNYHHFYPYELCNKLYQVAYLKKQGIQFVDLPLKDQAFFNVAIYKNLNTVVFNRQVFCKKNTSNHTTDGTNRELRWTIHLQLINQLKEVFRVWELSTEYEDLVANEYYQLLKNEVVSLLSPELSLSKQELKNEVDRRLNDDRLADIYTTGKRLSTKNLFERVLWNNFRKRNTRAIINLVQRRTQANNYKQKMRDRFGKWF